MIPYKTDRKLYAGQVDRDRLVDVLRMQRCFTAISGYEGEWDDLDWHVYSKKTHATIKRRKGEGDAPRVETLWTNQPADQQLELFA